MSLIRSAGVGNRPPRKKHCKSQEVSRPPPFFKETHNPDPWGSGVGEEKMDRSITSWFFFKLICFHA